MRGERNEFHSFHGAVRGNHQLDASQVLSGEAPRKLARQLRSDSDGKARPAEFAGVYISASWVSIRVSLSLIVSAVAVSALLQPRAPPQARGGPRD